MSEVEITKEQRETAILITLARIYDLMCVIANEIAPNASAEVFDLHEEGKLYGAPPFPEKEN